MKFEDLEFKPRFSSWDFLFDLLGMGCGSERALGEFENGYAISVIKDTYITTTQTYEIAILKKGEVLRVGDNKELHNTIKNLKLEHDESDCMVYGFVTKKQINKVMNLLEVIND